MGIGCGVLYPPVGIDYIDWYQSFVNANWGKVSIEDGIVQINAGSHILFIVKEGHPIKYATAVLFITEYEDIGARIDLSFRTRDDYCRIYGPDE